MRKEGESKRISRRGGGSGEKGPGKRGNGEREINKWMNKTNDYHSKNEITLAP